MLVLERDHIWLREHVAGGLRLALLELIAPADAYNEKASADD
jgi:hypothetical protein